MDAVGTSFLLESLGCPGRSRQSKRPKTNSGCSSSASCWSGPAVGTDDQADAKNGSLQAGYRPGVEGRLASYG
jgi:hypothetical protein